MSTAAHHFFLLCCRDKIGLPISANTVGYNIYTAAGSPKSPTDVIVTIFNDARVVGGSGFALTTGTGWPSGSTIFLDTGKGTIQGPGGAAGGHAIILDWPITIKNGSGFIFAGSDGGAIKTNGHEITWISGNDSTRLRGAVES